MYAAYLVINFIAASYTAPHIHSALKTKHDTPKYGLLYHASVVGQSTTKNKGKMSRMLAAKTSLVARVDALADEPSVDIGVEYRAQVAQLSICTFFISSSFLSFSG